MNLVQFLGLVAMAVLITAAGWGAALLHVRTERQNRKGGAELVNWDHPGVQLREPSAPGN